MGDHMHKTGHQSLEDCYIGQHLVFYILLSIDNNGLQANSAHNNKEWFSAFPWFSLKSFKFRMLTSSLPISAIFVEQMDKMIFQAYLIQQDLKFFFTLYKDRQREREHISYIALISIIPRTYNVPVWAPHCRLSSLSLCI